MRLLGRRSDDGRSASLIAALPAPRATTPSCSTRSPTLLRDALRDRRGRHRTPCSARTTGSACTSPCTSPGGVPDVSLRELEQELVSLTRTWEDGLRERLVDRFGPTRGRELAAHWGPRFPEYYRASVEPAVAVADVECFDRLEREQLPFVVGLQNEPGRTRVALYKTGGKVELGEAMPILEDLGLRVIEEVPTRLLGGDGDTWVQDFGVLGPGDRPLDLAEVGDRVADCIGGRAPRRRRVGLAQPARARRRARPGARSTSCARTACTASGSARASRRATRTTCSRPTRRSRRS